MSKHSDGVTRIASEVPQRAFKIRSDKRYYVKSNTYGIFLIHLGIESGNQSQSLSQDEVILSPGQWEILDQNNTGVR